MTMEARRTRTIKVQVTRLDMLISGELSVEDLDDEEIQRMQLRNNAGDFRGRPPLWVPHQLAQALRHEAFKRFQRQMQEMLPDAITAHKEMISSRHLAPGDAARLSAIKEVYERTFGKVTQNIDQHVVVDKGKTFDDFIEAALVDTEEET